MTNPARTQIGGLFDDWLKEEGIHEQATAAAIDRALRKASAANSQAVTRFILDDAQWQIFTAALDAPARSRLRLEALLREPGVFD